MLTATYPLVNITTYDSDATPTHDHDKPAEEDHGICTTLTVSCLLAYSAAHDLPITHDHD